jgi:hypothetical protein
MGPEPRRSKAAEEMVPYATRPTSYVSENLAKPLSTNGLGNENDEYVAVFFHRVPVDVLG